MFAESQPPNFRPHNSTHSQRVDTSSVPSSSIIPFAGWAGQKHELWQVKMPAEAVRAFHELCRAGGAFTVFRLRRQKGRRAEGHKRPVCILR